MKVNGIKYSRTGKNRFIVIVFDAINKTKNVQVGLKSFKETFKYEKGIYKNILKEFGKKLVGI